MKPSEIEKALKDAADEFDQLAMAHGESELAAVCTIAANHLRCAVVDLQWLPHIKKRPVET